LTIQKRLRQLKIKNRRY